VLKVSEDGDKMRAIGGGTVMLSAYGIERPAQLGVRTADEVTLRFDLAAISTPHSVATTGRRR
jgi:hypothetical protein